MRRSTSVWITILLSAAGTGFLAGTRPEWPSPLGYAPGHSSSTRLSTPGVPARSYRQLREGGTGPNDQIYLASRLTLIGLLPSLTEKLPPRDPADRWAALERRRARRAFDGAPPTIPHRVDSRQEPNCLVCHEHGAKIGELIAPQLSHPAFTSCPQCHVESAPSSALSGPADAVGAASPGAASPGAASPGAASPGAASPGAASPGAASPGATPAGSTNLFVPEPFGGRGARAWPGAPPVIPHRSFMRQRCNSCHGVSGAFGLRTPHAERQSCTQCHVEDHERDPSSFFASAQ